MKVKVGQSEKGILLKNISKLLNKRILLFQKDRQHPLLVENLKQIDEAIITYLDHLKDIGL